MTDKIIKMYKTIYAMDCEELDNKVAYFLNAGWSVYGNPYTSPFGKFFQAMVKEIESE